MKNILLIITLAFTTISCNNKTNSTQEPITTTDSTEVNRGLADQKPEPKELQGEDKIRSEINELYQNEAENCSQNITAVTDFNGRTEFWRICETGNGNRIILINSHEDSNLYGEIYFEQNGQLVYAEESIMYTPINHYILQPWVCQFYVENGKLVSLMSLGHGKTEDDDWNPEVIFDMYKNRIGELDRIKD